MKKCLLIAVTATAFAMPLLSQAQNYTLLNNDPNGDNPTLGLDLKSISWRYNLAQDSVWFKVESYTAITPTSDVGLMFGIDTNQVGTNGHTWMGTTNSSMKYDQALFVYQNGWFSGYYGELGDPGSANPVPVNVQLLNSNTLIINLKLSVLDPNKKFNMVLGSGGFSVSGTGQVYDDVPNTTFMTLQANNPSSVWETPVLEAMKIFPNPARTQVHWDHAPGRVHASDVVQLQDMSGRVIRSVAASEGRMPVEDLPAGIYRLRCNNAGATFSKE